MTNIIERMARRMAGEGNDFTPWLLDAKKALAVVIEELEDFASVLDAKPEKHGIRTMLKDLQVSMVRICANKLKDELK